MDYNPIEIFAVLVFFTGFYGLIASRSVVKAIVSTVLLEMAVIIFYVGFGYANGAAPPIGTEFTNATDPLPQALIFTAVIIGVTATAVNITMLLSLGRDKKTADWDEFKKKNSG